MHTLCAVLLLLLFWELVKHSKSNSQYMWLIADFILSIFYNYMLILTSKISEITGLVVNNNTNPDIDNDISIIILLRKMLLFTEIFANKVY